jgi:hypothetical protein
MRVKNSRSKNRPVLDATNPQNFVEPGLRFDILPGAVDSAPRLMPKPLL